MSRRAFDRRERDRGLAAYHDARHKDAMVGAVASGAALLSILTAIIFH